ncbi:amylo-alpha-1,6-glucosidase [Fulvivirga kasyanovii]|uniref:Amylo-alpha-1,6-glucosidase n=1 Tax=Fulvivirga kasyanovii TaxID=396812 RepID=A0ABW9RSG0_9BACT|nr:amylo-alpha-1,6-glucosidase [Fulvivirga kasyanovii]
MEIQEEKQVIEKGEFEVLADASYIDDRTQVLNHCDTFSITSRSGDILPLGKEVQGVYHQDTRFINELRLLLNDQYPVLLSSNIKEANDVLSVDLTNPLIALPDETKLPQGSIHLHRSQLVRNGRFHEKIEIENYLDHQIPLTISLQFDGDFKDIFEVRGLERERRGIYLGYEQLNDRTLKISYRGLDEVVRQCKVVFNRSFSTNESAGRVAFDLQLEPKKLQHIEYSLTFSQEGGSQDEVDYWQSRHANASDLDRGKDYLPIIETSNEQFTHWLNRSKADLVSLMADTPTGKYPYAGVPWYNTAFGRDGIITALETLWVAPKLSRDVLLFLAANQATTLDESIDAEPGKILHETRGGEMVALNEVPFKQYYGTIDATPLFVMLAGAYYERTGDMDTIKRIWPNVQKALDWIYQYGDLDGDGYVEYQHKSKNGLTNQGWKDSHDSVSHANGQLAEPAIALCEVQGYVYSAKLYGAKLAELFNETAKANQWRKSAEKLKIQFNKDFWDEALSCYVLALDGQKKPCRVKSSNAGQVLYTGIADCEKAERLSKTLLESDMYSGWGVRTLSQHEARYNPMSYHNGSVWPHDVALIADGMGQYGYPHNALKLMTGLFDASLFINLQRLPELFCGMDRREGEGPTAYPVACSPQAWSVAAVYLLLRSILQINIDNSKREVSFYKPILPEYLERVVIKNLDLGNQMVNLELTRHGKDNMIGVNWNYEGNEWVLKIIK